jgi:plastocyanin
MKKFYILVAAFFLFIGSLGAATHTITNVGTTFSPDSIVINVGDQVTFTLASFHNAVEVSYSTWLSNDTTSNGGFRLPNGGGTVTFNTPGTYYFVCQPHAYLAMKGQIIVNLAANIAGTNILSGNLNAYPNPARKFINLSFNVPENGRIKMDLIDMTGRIVSNLVDAEYSNGDYVISVPLAGYNSGRYFIRYTYGNAYKVKPIIIEQLR